MPYTPQAAYLESKVLTASPMELVRTLYRSAIEATGNALQHLAQGRIRERSQEVTRALDCLYELSGMLDHASGGTLSQSLAELYDYMQRRLLQANLEQKVEPLAEVERLLRTLLEGWEAIPEPDAYAAQPAATESIPYSPVLPMPDEA